MGNCDIQLLNISPKDLTWGILRVTQTFVPTGKPLPFNRITNGSREIFLHVALKTNCSSQHVVVFGNMPDALAGITLHVRDVRATVTIGPGHWSPWCARVLPRLWSSGACTSPWGEIATSLVVGRSFVVVVTRAGTGVTTITFKLINNRDTLDKQGASVKPPYPWSRDIAKMGYGVLVDACGQAVEAEVRRKILIVELFPVGVHV